MARKPQGLLPVPEKLLVWEHADRAVFPFGIEKLAVADGEGNAPNARVMASAEFLIIAVPGSDKGVGTVCKVLQSEGAGEGRMSLVVQGVCRTRFSRPKDGGTTAVRHAPLPDKPLKGSSPLAAAKIRGILDRLNGLAVSAGTISPAFVDELSRIRLPGRFSDILAQELSLPPDKAGELLSEADPRKRVDLLHKFLQSEIEIESIRVEMENKTYNEIDKRQREYFLKQQMETIQSELSQGREQEGTEAPYLGKAESLDAPEAVREHLVKEIGRLARLSPYSEETAQLKPYLDLVFDLPWGKFTEDNLDLGKVKRLLDKEHFGLQKVKRRILEHLAVLKIGGKGGGRIFCLVGPPGVGKTSLGKAIAGALGRKFVQMSLGGIKDEAEIRGHRKTYIGAMPGRIIQGLRMAKTMNPLFLLDEIDKVGMDFRGDPSSALLEALDPVQNNHFVDNYLGFPFDLSKVLFITTANTTEGIHPAFLDRLEILELPSYTEEEKISIAKRHLVKRIKASTGVGDRISIDDRAITAVIRSYTREAGLRNLERELEKIYRNAALKLARGKAVGERIGDQEARKILGPQPFFCNERMKKEKVGVATGLAYTEVGGEVLFVEASVIDGTGNLTLTGQLGEVMKESAQAALTFIRSKASELKLNARSLSKKDVHIHFPEGAIPKDGPSAGITIAVALYSVLTGKKVDRDTAFTGEITLRGDVLPVGGVREKILAAHRSRIRRVVLPSFNRKDTAELPKSVLSSTEMIFVDDIKEVFSHAF
ncbi:MAG TPA: endopeptidase La [Acidobacteriota bacterium]|nr:endopeptidase La [Acidobacteriota bacterium]HNT17228.1 endopeptidase La [Acidobacteriota bacterium]HPA26574.1 endopeptidase La [Acidobacteriota bacterium]HQO20205.1 endopeptidase La [Acidobacteriota bacterium]HQQ46951.1 endopeptidase La [Acidobacteriota bacterium]